MKLTALHVLHLAWLCITASSLDIKNVALNSSRNTQRSTEISQVQNFGRIKKEFLIKNNRDNKSDKPFIVSSRTKETNMSGVSTFTNSASCPARCTCTYRPPNTVDTVDCSNKELVEIPSLPLTATEVYLQGNKIDKFSCTAFTKMKSLLKLDISYNNITRLFPCSLVHLTSLQHLDLSQNQLTHIENNTFQGLHFLHSLSLKQNSLRYHPETFELQAFQGLTSLTYLHLEGNQPTLTKNFTYPDQALARVTSLQYLWLDGHPRALGPGFLTLHQLSFISFSSADGGFCHFNSDLPPNFFSNLGTRLPLTLNMPFCSISSIPPELFSFVPSIYSLDLSFNLDLTINGFERASKGLYNSSLTILNLNKIVPKFKFDSEVRETTFQYLKKTSLKFLSLERNNLMNIQPRAILDLPETVEYLSFYRNSILAGYAFETTVRLTNLKTFMVSFETPYFSSKREYFNSYFEKETQKFITSNNQIARKPKIYNINILHNAIYPQVLKKDDNKTHEKGNIIKNKEYCDHTASLESPYPIPPKLVKFHGSGYKFNNGLPEIKLYGNKVLEYLEVPNNGFKCFGGPIHGPESLHYIDLSKNWAFLLNPYFFSGNPSIRTILLSQNRFGRALQEDVKGITFSNLTRLEKLDLSNNVIEVLSQRAFENNRNLKVLNLSNNAIRHFTPSLAFNLQLVTLDLSYNPLEGLSQLTCRQFSNIKHTNPSFVVNITRVHRFSCSCAFLYFLNFLIQEPEIFEDVTSFSCRLSNGSSISYARLPEVLPKLGYQCQIRSVFLCIMAAFFLLVGSLSVFGLYNFKRWQWKYLHYMGRSRLHIGSTHLTYKPVADAFVTYDQEDARMRRVMRSLVLARLHQMELTTVLGELDFTGGPLAPSIAGAVASTVKTVVFLTPDIFEDFHRRLEVNLAIMHELELGRPVLVPVLVFRSGVRRAAGRGLGACNELVPVQSMMAAIEEATSIRRDETGVSRRQEDWRFQVTHQGELTQFLRLVRKFPPEIATFLKGQLHRCLVFTADTPSFWRSLHHVILEE